jgi:hypothetical protein
MNLKSAEKLENFTPFQSWMSRSTLFPSSVAPHLHESHLRAHSLRLSVTRGSIGSHQSGIPTIGILVQKSCSFLRPFF